MKSKFNFGDTVWFIHKDLPKEAKIHFIRAGIGNPLLGQKAFVAYDLELMSPYNIVERIPEARVYKSREHLRKCL